MEQLKELLLQISYHSDVFIGGIESRCNTQMNSGWAITIKNTNLYFGRSAGYNDDDEKGYFVSIGKETYYDFQPLIKEVHNKLSSAYIKQRKKAETETIDNVLRDWQEILPHSVKSNK